MGVDIGARKRAEAEAGLLRTIALGVGEAEDLDEALRFVLRQVCETTGWTMGEAWLPNADRSRLECHPVWHGVAPGLAEFRQISRQLSFAPGEGLPGRVWQTKQAEWIADLGPRSRFPRLEVARRAGLAAGLGVPVLAHGEVVLVLDFFLFEPTDEDVQQMRLIAAVAAQIGSLIGRKQAEAARTASESHFRRLIENASDLVTLVDAHGVVRFQGPSSERLLGYTPEEMTNGSDLRTDSSRRRVEGRRRHRSRTDEPGGLHERGVSLPPQGRLVAHAAVDRPGHRGLLRRERRRPQLA